MPTDTANLIGGFLHTKFYIMITREDYLNALELIDKYNRQFNESEHTDKKKQLYDMELYEFAHKMHVSRRLENAFRAAKNVLGWTVVGDIKPREFLKLKGVGKKCLTELEWYLELHKEENKIQ